jgi:molybdenum cofactor cytidylyltransferase
MTTEASVAAVVLAAGSSSRMGTNKMLLELGGETVLRRAVRTAREAGLDPAVVVTGHQADRTRAQVADLDCVLVHNDEHEVGIHTSVRAGIAGLPSSTDAAVVMLADMPFVTARMLRDLVKRYRESDAPLVISTYGDVNAPPMLYDRSLFGELAVMQRRCGKEVIARHRDEARVLRWPQGALADLDTPEDYDRIAAEIAAEATP